MNMGSATAAGIADRPHLAFVRALSSGDLDSAIACFARDGCLVTPDLTAVHGRDRIRPVLAQLVAARVEIRVESGGLIAAGDALLARERWTIRTGGAATAQVQTSEPTLVMRLIEGSWKLVIAAPWGWADGRP
jgi:ketosteroid isomerase-like protein